MSTPPRKTYSLKIEGGDPFAIQIKANPPLIHHGDLTLWVGHLDRETHSHLMSALAEVCSTGSVSCSLTSESEAQKAIRSKRAQEGLPFFQAPECPSCFFYDLDTPSQCGLDDWDSPTIEMALESKAAIGS